MSAPSTLAPMAPAPDRAVAPKDRARFPLDPVRGLAAVAVIFFHANQNQQGSVPRTPLGTDIAEALHLLSDLSVDLFFVLSGFVLFLPAARAGLAGALPRSGRELLLRRCARLLPLYLTVVLVVWSLTNTSLPGNWKDLVLHLTMTHVYSQEYIFWTAGPAWSLAVEFHFYLLMALAVPVIGRTCARLRGRPARTAVLLGLPLAMIAVGQAWLWWAVGHRAVDSWPTWFGPVAKAPIFALGMLLAVAVAAGAEIRSRRARQSLVAAGLVGVVGVHLLRPSTDLSTVAQLWHLPLGVLATGWLAAIVMNPAAPGRWLRRPALVALGTVSYGIYLLHEPLMRLLRHSGVLPAPDGGTWDWVLTAAVLLPVTLLVARLSYLYLELNGLRLLHLLGPGGRRREYYPHSVDPVDLSSVPLPPRLVPVRVPSQRQRRD